MSTRRDQLSKLRSRDRRMTTPFKEFGPYEDGRIRSLRFDVNALADFEQETGMGFAQLMKQRAIFANARAMLWAGLKHEDRTLTIEAVGDLISDYLVDQDVPPGEHTIDTVLMVAFNAAIDQGALGLVRKTEEDEVVDQAKKEIAEGDATKPVDPEVLPPEADGPRR